jgi:thymidine kinase
MKFSRDDRYSAEKIATHDQLTHEAIPCTMLMDHINTCYAYDVIGIDEAQFFPDLIEFTEELTNRGKTVIAAGLDGDFQRKPFGKVLDLMSKCESITKLSAVCTETAADAFFTQRTVEFQGLELIGGAESYRAASRSSFFHSKTPGEIHLTLGPVRSGKTTDLLRVLRRHAIANRKPVLIRHTASPDANPNTDYPVLVVDTLPEVEKIAQYDVIGVDEGHRFEDIAGWADELANRGILVSISALDGNVERVPYDSIVKLFPLCEKVKKLDAVCPMTGLPAPFSTQLNDAIVPISRFALLQTARLAEAA